MLTIVRLRGHRLAASLVVASCLALVGVGLAAVLWATDATSSDESELVIVTDEAKHPFRVELARTAAERSQGLMYRRNLAADRGMLFLYPVPQPVGMWMKNTYIPLDMLFIADDGRISHIAANTTPHSEATISSNGPARAVLELNAGTAERLGIEVGDRVEHPLLDGP